MAKIETRGVYRKSDGRRTIINVQDYDPEIHATSLDAVKDKLTDEEYDEEREQGQKNIAVAQKKATKAAALKRATKAASNKLKDG